MSEVMLVGAGMKSLACGYLWISKTAAVDQTMIKIKPSAERDLTGALNLRWLSHKETRATRTTRREPPSAVPPFSCTESGLWKSMAVWEHDGKKPSLYLTKMGI
ncbi:hypothetical protein AGOR_G00244460 [Albula goreensis]|uniref:Uncharacterized protein n=1 Tax=Albula goreensis TaxID=1534307 RepID=A0A8T3CF08_9TELE|nr:hypothetical protein AGOR_G00244460 [Albula goreensis]